SEHPKQGTCKGSPGWMRPRGWVRLLIGRSLGRFAGLVPSGREAWPLRPPRTRNPRKRSVRFGEPSTHADDDPTTDDTDLHRSSIGGIGGSSGRVERGGAHDADRG